MSTNSATSPTKDWKETKDETLELLPENCETPEDFIIDMARAFFNPSYLLMRTEAGRMLVLEELEEKLTNRFMSDWNKEAILAFAPDIIEYVKDIIEEMMPNEPRPELDNLNDKHDTELRDLTFKKHVNELLHMELTPNFIDEDIYSRQKEDLEARRITESGMTVHDIIKERYPDLYNDHILALVPYVQSAITTNNCFSTKVKINKEALRIMSELDRSTSSDSS